MELDLDEAINQLLSALGHPPGTEVSLPEEVLIKIVRASRSIFLRQPMLLELEAPINICGDTHGQYSDLLKLFESVGFPGSQNYLFLGDYVDRAKQSVETIILCFCFKIKYQNNFFMLRGNHESAALNRIYGFYDECKRRYSVKLWRIFCDCFNCMPVAAVVADKIVCMHGGLSPELEELGQIFEITRPVEVKDEGLLCDLLWADPEPTGRGWGYNARGVSYTFGPDILHKFLASHDLDLLVRAHQVVEDGYEFSMDRKMVTIFSAPNYCGEFDNAGAVLVVDADLNCSFKILRPLLHRERFSTLDDSPAQVVNNSKRQQQRAKLA